ncbi:hypothetical protein OIU79_019714 [Salix purpurea]|uniref:Smr domain-containing protein n=1 Tax=Salix purpurea TaxID=77065 RepID=A0A9Q0P2B4_SALPP|nr:hypothetical protein OIU79_019714 [Salix purpurea]
MHQTPPATATATTTTTTHHPQIHPTFPSLQSPKSELASDFSGRRSTRFVSKLNFGRHRTTMGTRHTSVAEEALQNVIEYGKDERGLENVLLNFEARLSGSDDYIFLLRELVKRERKKNEQGKLASAMISTLGRLGKAEIAKGVFEAALIEGYGTTVYAFSAIISAYGRSGYCDEAIKVFDSMKDYGLKPNLVTYNAVIDACGKGGLGRFQEALDVCREMENCGIRKDVVTYNALLGGYGKQCKYDEVVCIGKQWMLFREFKKAGLKADVVLYSAVIDALCKNGLVESAVSLLDEMTKEGIRPNVVTYNSIIDAFGRPAITKLVVDDTGRTSQLQIESLSSDVVEEASKSLLADREGNQIIKIFGQLATEKAGQANNCVRQEMMCILAVFHKMHELEIKPNVVTFSAILNACSRCNSFEDASMLLEELRLFDNQVYGVAHGLLMGCRENVWNRAQSLFDEVKLMDSPTESAFYNALTDMLWNFGQKRGAQLVVLEGKRRQVWENVWSESCLDLHLMSSGAARAMVHAWLLNIRSIVFEGHELPKLLSILTGWGKHSKVVGDSTLRRAIEALLMGMGAPFRTDQENLSLEMKLGGKATANPRINSPFMLNIALHS